MWPYPTLSRCPVCPSVSLLYFPFSSTEIRVLCTVCKWKAHIGADLTERNATLDDLPDAAEQELALHEQRLPKVSKRPTENGIGGDQRPPAVGLDLELGRAGQTVRPGASFVSMPDPPWATRPPSGSPVPVMEESVSQGLDDLFDPEEWGKPS